MNSIIIKISTLLLLLFLGANAHAQRIVPINPNDVIPVTILKIETSYETRARMINQLRYGHYSKMVMTVNDIRDAQIYCNNIVRHAGNNSDQVIYGAREYWASFQESFNRRDQDCDDIAIAVASLLYDNDFHPYFLLLRTEIPTRGHLVFIYKNQKGKFGTIGKGSDTKWAKYKDLPSLIKRFSKDMGLEFSLERSFILDAKQIFPEAISVKKNYARYCWFK